MKKSRLLMIVYGDKKSGNCYKIQLLCSNLGLTYKWQDIDILKKETQSQGFLDKNPNGKIPLLELDNGQLLSESNAILYYLATNTKLLPQDDYQQALVIQWQCFEQYSHEPNIAVARFIQTYLGLPNERITEYQQKQQGGYKALDVMEMHLLDKDFFVDNTYSIADISLYAYTHVAYQGGFSLINYPNINRWLANIERQSGYCKMDS